MGLLSTLTSAAGSLLGGDTLKDVGGIIDNLHTSGEEKAEAKERITTILAQAEQAAQAQVSARWEADMKHGSWLSKNIRPLTLVFLTAIFTVLSVFDGNLQIGGKAWTGKLTSGGTVWEYSTQSAANTKMAQLDSADSTNRRYKVVEI